MLRRCAPSSRSPLRPFPFDAFARGWPRKWRRRRRRHSLAFRGGGISLRHRAIMPPCRAAGAALRAAPACAPMALVMSAPIPGPLIGMVHLAALPGSPRWAGNMARVLEAAVADARTWAEAGADALLVENHGDVPFAPDRVDSASVAGMAVAVAEVR